MDMMNFYFTAGVTSGNASRDFSHDISQTFFREILERKLKSPNLIISDSHAIGRHLSSFYKSGPKQIKTDISGIIIPVAMEMLVIISILLSQFLEILIETFVLFGKNMILLRNIHKTSLFLKKEVN